MEENDKFTRDGPKTFTHGRAERSAGRIQKELDSLCDQNAPHSFRIALEAIIVGLMEYEQRNRPVDLEKLAGDVLGRIRAKREDNNGAQDQDEE